VKKITGMQNNGTTHKFVELTINSNNWKKNSKRIRLLLEKLQIHNANRIWILFKEGSPEKTSSDYAPTAKETGHKKNKGFV
jgi:hypothetical protein